jgi:hypothetical protein
VVETRGVVGHGVLGSGEEIMQRDVPVVATVDGLHSEEVGWRRGGGGETLLLPVWSGCVVGAGLEGALSHVKAMHACFVVENAASEFEIGVGYGAFGVFKGNQVGDDVGRERSAPNNWCSDGRGGRDYEVQ